MDELDDLREQLRAFAAERDWEPVPLAEEPRDGAVRRRRRSCSRSSSGSPRRRAARSRPERKAAASEEIADVLLYLVRLADELGIDPVAAARTQAGANEQKYPVDKARGNSKKYTEL